MLSKAFAYKRWSDLRTLDAVRRIDGAAFPDAVAFARQQLDHIVILQRVRLCADRLAVHDRLRAFHVRDEVALRAACDNGNLYARTAERDQRFAQFELLACARATQHLDLAQGEVGVARSVLGSSRG